MHETLHVLQQPCMSCGSLASSLDRTRNARQMNMSKILFLLLRPLGVLCCCTQHRKKAARNQVICHNREVYGCRMTNVKQALLSTYTQKPPLNPCADITSRSEFWSEFSTTFIFVCVCEQQRFGKVPQHFFLPEPSLLYNGISIIILCAG